MFALQVFTVVLTLILSTVVYAQSTTTRPPVPGAPAGVTAFVNVNVVPMDTERVLPRHTVLVEGGWITALGPASQVKVPVNAVRIDGQGQYLIPGLGDMHAHTLDIFGSMDSSTMAHTLEQWIAIGVTTVRIMDSWLNNSPGAMMSTARGWAASGQSWLPRIYSPPNDHFKTYYEDSSAFAALAARARQGGPPLMGHVPPRIPIEYALTSGLRSIEHFTGYIPWAYAIQDHKERAERQRRGLPLNEGDGTFASPPDTSSTRIRALANATKRAGVWNTPTMVILTSPGVAANGGDTAAVMALLKRYVKIFHEVGAGLLLGSDAGTHIHPGWAVHRELEHFVNAGLTPYQALLTGTRNVAAFYSTLGESGTIAVGKRADLVLLGGNPLQDIRQTRQLNGVMIGGRWLSQENLRTLGSWRMPLAAPLASVESHGIWDR